MRERWRLLWHRRRWGVLTLAVLVLVIALDYFLYPRLAPMAGRSLNTGENGLWIRYNWYFGKQLANEQSVKDDATLQELTDADYAILAKRVRQAKVRYAYCHVRYIDSDGHLHFRFLSTARRLVNELHRRAPGTRVVAWVYVGGVTEYPPVRLTDARVRAAMVGEAVWLVKKCGFDGIQWDYERCNNGDSGHLALLRETRAALPDTFLSTCAQPWYPTPVTNWYGWDETYFTQVARECDQVAVMGYDTGMWLPRSYVWLMREQMPHVTRAVHAGNPTCRVMLGVPTYGKAGWGHNLQSETLRLALKGVREGANDPRTDAAAFDGVAIFAEHTTTVAEWREYRRDWLGINQ